MSDSTGTARMGAASTTGDDEARRFFLLADHSLSGVFVIEGRNFSYVNPRFCELAGRPCEDLLALRNALDIVDKEMRVAVEKAIDELHQGGEASRTLDFTVTRGKLGTVALRANLVVQPDADKPTVLGSVEDIGETDRLKESLHNAEERFRYAARASQELIWECNLANQRLWCNEGILTVFQHSSKSAPKNLEQLLDCVHPDEQESVRAGLKQLAAGAKPLWLSEFRFRRSDGAWAHVLARAFVLLNTDRKPHRLIGSMFDNTQHRTMETRLMESQRLSSLGSMANGLAHDVNNLLTPILTAAQRLKEDVFIDEHQTALLETIEDNCKRGASLAEELMKIGDGQSKAPVPCGSTN